VTKCGRSKKDDGATKATDNHSGHQRNRVAMAFRETATPVTADQGVDNPAPKKAKKTESKGKHNQNQSHRRLHDYNNQGDCAAGRGNREDGANANEGQREDGRQQAGEKPDCS
jgi:hypothetical protein